MGVFDSLWCAEGRASVHVDKKTHADHVKVRIFAACTIS